MPHQKGLKICCVVTTIFLITLVAVITTLGLTIFKPKQPEITAYPIGLENITFNLFPNITMNVTLGMVITIDNHRNYGGFNFENSTANVDYHGVIVSQVPIMQDFVPARGKINIATSADLMVDRLLTNPDFVSDVLAGSLNFTSMAVLHGKVNLFKILSLRATTASVCDISVFILSHNVESICYAKIKL